MSEHDGVATRRETEAALTTRRDFLDKAAAAGAVLVLAEAVTRSTAGAQSPAPSPSPTPSLPPPDACIPKSSKAFVPVTEIVSKDKKLRAVMRVTNGTRTVPTSFTADTIGTTPMMLRYFAGYNPSDHSQAWPPASSTAPGPGPTFRCALGDVVQIALLNNVDVAAFGGSLDAGEEGRQHGCDQGTVVNPDGTANKNYYPDQDTYPDCLHGSRSANIHFHGTHVTPSTTGDNVLVNVRPSMKARARDVLPEFERIFDHCELGRQPKRWEDLPRAWRATQEKLLKEYDRTAPYQGGHGLPLHQRLWPQNKEAIDQHVWPQWYVGSYPYCFQIPAYRDKNGKRTGVKMGQAPGTHWYHSHKHGSTAINMFNGMSGALIIRDDSPTGYDGKLQSFYAHKLDELVLVFQQITAVPNLLAAKSQRRPLLVNGQMAPTITMRPGQVQLWRMINAAVSATVTFALTPISAGAQPINVRQTAQDGVQFSYAVYNGKPPLLPLAPANRVDVLVQAPSAKGCYRLGPANNPTLFVNVTGTAIAPAMPFPEQESDFPKLPEFLHDIPAGSIRLRREIDYGWNPALPGANHFGPGNHPPHFTINGKQFENEIVDEVMLLGSHEEWTITNSTLGVAHPFHIHINPFQITEVFDPNTMTEPLKLKPPFVWWDTFAIPAAKQDAGQPLIPGYFKMRTRFVDFTGLYVQHCHILAHEDRGMMQLLQVVDNHTLFKHQ